MNPAVRNTNVIIGVKPDNNKTVKTPVPAQAKNRWLEMIEELDNTGKYAYDVVIWYGNGRMIKMCTCKGTPKDTDGGGTTDFTEVRAGTDPTDPLDD